MPKIIICLNYNNAGERYIAYLKYSTDYTISEIKSIAYHLKEDFDEVYITDFDPAHDNFIQYIVLNACRM